MVVFTGAGGVEVITVIMLDVCEVVSTSVSVAATVVTSVVVVVSY